MEVTGEASAPGGSYPGNGAPAYRGQDPPGRPGAITRPLRGKALGLLGSSVKICLVSARFPPQRCGVGDYTCFLGRALARAGHNVDVLTGVGELDELLYPLPSNVQVHRVIGSWGSDGLRDVVRHLRNLDPQVLLIQYTPHAFDRRGITFAVNVLP